MKIACISASMIPGRTANAIQTMKACEALASLGHEVRLWLPDFGDEFSWDEASEMYGLSQVFQVRRLRVLMALGRYDFSLRAVLEAQRWGADLLYVWPLQAAAFASQVGSPTVLEMHDEPSGRMGPWLFRQYLRGSGARCLLFTTHELERHLSVQFDAARIRELARYGPNGVDLERYRNLPGPSAARGQLGLEDRFTAVYTGHLYQGRGADLMFALAQRQPEVNFLWAGGTKEAIENWRQRIEQAELENLKLMGFVPNQRLPLVQAAGEVLLMPYERRIEVSGGGDSARFASPMKIFEYLAAGRAIMSSDLPILREVISEESAVLLPPEDLEAWHAGLAELRADEAGRQALGRAARQLAEQHSWQARASRALAGIAEPDKGG